VIVGVTSGELPANAEDASAAPAGMIFPHGRLLRADPLRFALGWPVGNVNGGRDPPVLVFNGLDGNGDGSNPG
jgi:hypothetical protein